MTTNKPVFGSPEWHAQNAAEVASRPVTNKVRKPLTPEEFESYKPKASK